MTPFLEEAVDAVLAGNVVIYPTETVYGIGGDAENDELIQKVQTIKGRDATKPMLVLTDDWDRVVGWIAEYTSIHRKLMDASLPITLLFHPTHLVPTRLRGLSALIGIRKTSHSFCKALIEKTDRLLLSTSANPAGSAPVNDLKNLPSSFLLNVDCVVDAGALPEAPPSSVVAISDGQLKLLREGAVGMAELNRLLASS
ncbi:MAG: threonylcarbamoyl-AMP synthase [Bacteroidetes Order II. Incertae sedis bacterium]|nr:threonylcarbamoyl-AMP synthase [Bacteroidetes Order II. bacterium]